MSKEHVSARIQRAAPRIDRFQNGTCGFKFEIWDLEDGDCDFLVSCRRVDSPFSFLIDEENADLAMDTCASIRETCIRSKRCQLEDRRSFLRLIDNSNS